MSSCPFPTTKTITPRSLFSSLSLGFVVWSRFDELIVSQNLRILWASHSSGHIPLLRKVKFPFLAKFPVDHLPNPVVSSLIHILCWIHLLYDWSFHLYHYKTHIFNAGKSSSSFFDTYSLSTSSLRSKAQCIVMGFLVFWSICSSVYVHFKNGPEYLTKGTVQVFISFIIILPYSLVSSSFLFLLRYFLNFFLFGGVYIQYSLVFVRCLCPSILILLNLVISFFLLCVVYRFSFLAWCSFLYQIPSMSRLYIFTSCIRVSGSFSF